MITFYAGARFGRLVLRQKTRESSKVSPTIRRQWVCDCDCGQRVTVPEYYLRRIPNPKTNCGDCPDLKSNKTVHKNLYMIWYMMNVRCSDPRHVGHRHYGGRGICVCPEWSDPVTGFDAFLDYVQNHLGKRPSILHTLDRYPNPDGNYEPGNIRWATAEQQAANKRKRPTQSNPSLSP